MCPFKWGILPFFFLRNVSLALANPLPPNYLSSSPQVKNNPLPLFRKLYPTPTKCRSTKISIIPSKDTKLDMPCEVDRLAFETVRTKLSNA